MEHWAYFAECYLKANLLPLKDREVPVRGTIPPITEEAAGSPEGTAVKGAKSFGKRPDRGRRNDSITWSEDVPEEAGQDEKPTYRYRYPLSYRPKREPRPMVQQTDEEYNQGWSTDDERGAREEEEKEEVEEPFSSPSSSSSSSSSTVSPISARASAGQPAIPRSPSAHRAEDALVGRKILDILNSSSPGSPSPPSPRHTPPAQQRGQGEKESANKKKKRRRFSLAAMKESLEGNSLAL
ncbi:hypothetical protein BDY17DRAFT_19349 [Neohortaea acidophila]|uniref:Uncharacterized protein n=1 Tax=Neohortaea acidophila TaxID=245834 RepID=A0A6A6Q8Y0_9PEZI|nr:uncharacterized protein BDY17DRAFT_19349 [Neohortaea acidophila]KAF2487837.1 hypothetical protein BDY17DRAFT_19349 [Neohortaea acidophila]